MAGPDNYVSYAPPSGIPDLDFISTEDYDARSNTMPDNQDSRHAIFYDDGPQAGYLHVRDIGSGAEGQTTLVQSVADGMLYVRKISRLRDIDSDASSTFGAATEAPGQHQLEPRDVSHYRPYPNIPGLIDFTTLVHNPPHTVCRNVKQFVTYWQFCNGGDLEHYIEQHSRLNERIPEIIIWRFLWQIFKTCEYLHHCQPPVSHRDIFSGNIFLHFKPDLECRSGERSSIDEAAEFDYYDTFPDHGNGNVPDFYLGDFGHAVSEYRTPELRQKSLRHDIECISEVFKKLVLCTAKLEENDSTYMTLLADLTWLNELTDSKIRNRSYSADLVKIWDEISSLKKHFANTTDVKSEPLDMKPFQDFIKTLGKLYPKVYADPTVKFTPPAPTAPPALFSSREQLLSCHGRMSGGPWYICIINANHEIRVINEAYGNPGQSPPADVSSVTDPESSSSEYSAAPATTSVAFEPQYSKLTVQTQTMNPEALLFTPRFDSATPTNARQEAFAETGLTQGEELLLQQLSYSQLPTLDGESDEAMSDLGDGSCQYGEEDDDDDDDDDMEGSL